MRRQRVDSLDTIKGIHLSLVVVAMDKLRVGLEAASSSHIRGAVDTTVSQANVSIHRLIHRVRLQETGTVKSHAPGNFFTNSAPDFATQGQGGAVQQNLINRGIKLGQVQETLKFIRNGAGGKEEEKERGKGEGEEGEGMHFLYSCGCVCVVNFVVVVVG
jgi:hypothetical protein